MVEYIRDVIFVLTHLITFEARARMNEPRFHQKRASERELENSFAPHQDQVASGAAEGIDVKIS